MINIQSSTTQDEKCSNMPKYNNQITKRQRQDQTSPTIIHLQTTNPENRKNNQIQVVGEGDLSLKNKNSMIDRPVSFASSMFIYHHKSIIKVEKNPAWEGIKKQQKVTSMFATFANSQDQQQQMPYFQQICQQSKEKETYDKIDDQVCSYKSNFLNDFNDISLQDGLVYQQVNEKHIQINEASNQSSSKNEISVLAVSAQQKSQSFHKGKTMECDAVLKLPKNKTQHITFKITEQAIIIQEVPIQLKSISKIKMYPLSQQDPKYNTLKINIKGMGEQLYLGLRRNSKYGQYALIYYTFAKIIIKKLKYFGIANVTDWNRPQRQPHVYHIAKKVKISTKKQEKNINNKIKSNTGEDYSDKSKPFRQRSISAQNNGMKKSKSSQSVKKYAAAVCKAATYIHGTVYKKSKHWGNWEKRYIQVNEAGIFSYRHEEDETASIKIQRKSIKYIWTWFSILIEQKADANASKAKFLKNEGIKTVQYEERLVLQRMATEASDEQIKYLIIKVKHGFSQQSEFGIPICNFDSDSNYKNWLYAFYRVLPILQNTN